MLAALRVIFLLYISVFCLVFAQPVCVEIAKISFPTIMFKLCSKIFTVLKVPSISPLMFTYFFGRRRDGDLMDG